MGTLNENDEIVSVCCVCGRHRVAGHWQPKDDSPEAARVDPSRASHTYCPECLRSASPRRRTSGRAMLIRPITAELLLVSLLAVATAA